MLGADATAGLAKSKFDIPDSAFAALSRLYLSFPNTSKFLVVGLLLLPVGLYQIVSAGLVGDYTLVDLAELEAGQLPESEWIATRG